MFLEQKQLRVLVVYICCMLLSKAILYTTALENRTMPILIRNPRNSRISMGILVVYTAVARTQRGPKSYRNHRPSSPWSRDFINIRKAMVSVGVGTVSGDRFQIQI